MRRSVATTVLCIVPAVVAGGVFLAACEDGPAQTFSPATGILFNNGNVDASYDPVEASLDANYAGRTVLQICTAELLRERWAKMLTEPIAPPTTFAGLDLRGGPEWPGLTVEQAEQAPDPNTLEGGNCQGTAQGQGGCGENQNDQCGDVTWGDNGEVSFSYDVGTHVIDQLDLHLGYTGTMQFGSPPSTATNCANQPYAKASHTYVLQIGFPVLKDGHTFIMDWGTGAQFGYDSTTGTTDTCTYASGGCGSSELYDAITYTFDSGAGVAFPGCSGTAPNPNPKNLPNADGCEGDGTCLYIANDGAGVAYFGVRPLATYLQFYSTIPQPAASEPFNMYIDYAKFVPNSTLPMTLMLNQTGPYTNGTPLGATGINCQQAVGQNWSNLGNGTDNSYLTTCIMPFPTPGSMGNMQNAINYNKLTGGHTHNVEEITFNVVGVNQDFALSSGNAGLTPLPQGTDLGVYGVVNDTQLPSPGDLSTEWYFDVRAFGIPANESCLKGSPNFPKCVAGSPDFHGSGLVSREYQRLVEMDLATLAGKLPSDPETCTFIAGGPYPTPVDDKHVCTGFEGMVYAGYSQYATDPPGVGAYLDLAVIGLGDTAACLKPGDHYITFLANPAFQSEPGSPSPAYDLGPWWDESLDWVTRVMGQGDIHNLPPAAQDRRYYFKWFGVAMIKYLKAYGDAEAKAPGTGQAITPTDVANEKIDLETLFFDNQYGAQFDSFEYIDLSTIAGFAGNKTTPEPSTKPYLGVPFDYEYGTDVKVANQRYTNWYKRLDREEIALYQALSVEPKSTNYVASNANEGVNLTNMYGSTLLAGLGPYECFAVPATFNAGKGVWVWPDSGKGSDKRFPKVNEDCAGVNIPNWLAASDSKGNVFSLGDLNGQMALEEENAGLGKVAEGGVPYQTAPGAYQAFVDGQTHTLLWQYPAAFGAFSKADPTPGSTVFSQGHSPITVCPTGATNCPDPNQKTSVTSVSIGAAQVSIPNFKNPWQACFQAVPGTANPTGCDPQSNTYVDGQLYAYVPWTPNQPGVGFPIPVNGSSNLWVQTAQLDFSGNLETYVVDYVPYADPGMTMSCNYGAKCNPGYVCDPAGSGACIASDNTIEIRAIEAHDFLGEVFPCKDPSTGDILHVRMYTSTYDILTWMANHPGEPSNPNDGNPSAQTACGMIVRYSPFDNYPDFIDSLIYGVDMNTNQGQGFGRIVDATLYNPLYETIDQ